METSLYGEEIRLQPFPQVFASVRLYCCTKFGATELPAAQKKISFFGPGVTSRMPLKQFEPLR